MFTKLDEINLINASNASDDFLNKNFIRSETEFEDFDISSSGLPLLVAADPKVFIFRPKDTFKISKEKILKKIYQLQDIEYSGFKHAFYNNELFLSNFEVRDSYKKFVEMITIQNTRSKQNIGYLLSRHSSVGAFQTRNIPHAGHEKIMARMLENCDHLVINPVIGPKKIGDVNIDSLRMIYNFLIKYKYGDRVSFQPIYANMFYAGPREAVHHALLRKRLGFDLFSVGRDHAGAEGVYPPEAAPNLVTKFKDIIGLDIISHQGAALCTSCNEVVIIGECPHETGSLQDIAGTSFRKCLRETRLFELADKKMLEYIYNSKMELFEK